ncbi:glucosamine kinase [Rhizobiales bacterium GAS188]|nr:glucosamine kinase [Rhizobiales bacterium GAS188]
MSSGSTLFIGVDGGGTGCRARLEDAEGCVLGAGVAGPAALRFGIDAALEAVGDACRQALAEAGLDDRDRARIHAGIGLAGIGRKGMPEALAARPSPWASVNYASDGLVACLGAHSGEDGGIVIVGTGSIALARIAGREERIGGYGFPIGDEGSGADLGLKAIRLALRAHDGRIDATGLLRDVMTRLGGDPTDAIAWMDKATATDYAAFAPLVIRHANEGDPVARRIVQRGAEHIDELVRALLARQVHKIALIGGLASPMEPWLAPDVRRRLKPLDHDQITGALYLTPRQQLQAE